MNRCDDISPIVRYAQLQHRGDRPHSIGNGAQQHVYAISRCSRNGDRSMMIGRQFGCNFWSYVLLVEDEQFGYVLRPDLCQDFAHRGDLTTRIGSGAIHDVHQKIARCRHIQGALERLDQPVWQAPHEPHRVAHQDRLATR